MCTALSQCLHCTVEDAVTYQRTPYNIHANTTDDHSLCGPWWAPMELLLHCRRPYCAAMVTLWRPHCALIRTPSDGVCFEHAQNAHCRLAFYAIPQHLLAVPLHCCGDACDRTVCTSAFCIFLDAMRMLLWCYRGSRSYGDWGHSLKSHPTDWRSQGSKLRPLVYKVSGLLHYTTVAPKWMLF